MAPTSRTATSMAARRTVELPCHSRLEVERRYRPKFAIAIMVSNRPMPMAYHQASSPTAADGSASAARIAAPTARRRHPVERSDLWSPVLVTDVPHRLSTSPRRAAPLVMAWPARARRWLPLHPRNARARPQARMAPRPQYQLGNQRLAADLGTRSPAAVRCSVESIGSHRSATL